MLDLRGRLTSYLSRLRDRGAAWTLSVSDGLATMSFAIHQPGVQSTEQIADLFIASATSMLRGLCGSEWRPDEVHLPRCRPADAEMYPCFFRAPVRFDQETASLVFPSRWLNHLIPGADEWFRCLLEERLRKLEDVEERELADECCAAVSKLVIARHAKSRIRSPCIGVH